MLHTQLTLQRTSGHHALRYSRTLLLAVGGEGDMSGPNNRNQAQPDPKNLIPPEYQPIPKYAVVSVDGMRTVCWWPGSMQLVFRRVFWLVCVLPSVLIVIVGMRSAIPRMTASDAETP